MNELIQAAESIEREAKKNEHFVKAAAAMKRIGSLEQAEAEVTERIALLRSQSEQAEKDLAAKLEEVRTAESKVKVIMDAANAEAQRVKQDATKESDALLAKARTESDALRSASSLEAAGRLGQETIARVSEEAKAILAKAREDAQASVSEAQAEIAKFTNKRDEIEQLAVQAEKKKADAERELSDIEGKIAAARAQVRLIMGG